MFRELVQTHLKEVDADIRADFSFLVETALQNDRYRTFIACASKEPDNLTLWRNYTGSEVGFAVALDGRKSLLMRRQRPVTEKMIDPLGFLEEEDKQLVRDQAAGVSGQFGWSPAVYFRAEQAKIAWEALRGIEAAALPQTEGTEGTVLENDWLHAFANVAMAFPTFKNTAFKDEAEMRIVCGAAIHADLMYLKHRTGRYGIIPYVELGLPEDPLRDLGDGPEPMGELPILGVAVGPTRYQEEAIVGVKELLRSHGHQTIAVIGSRTPFRS